jgi:hypothetical protein
MKTMTEENLPLTHRQVEYFPAQGELECERRSLVTRMKAVIVVVILVIVVILATGERYYQSCMS